MKANKSLRPVLVALSVMLLGLFMLCAHNQTIETPGEDLAGGDDEFRQELLDMLDLASDDSEAQVFAAGDVVEEAPENNTVESSENSDSAELSGDDQAELMALLAGVEEEADSGQPDQQSVEATSESFEGATAAPGITANDLDNLRSEVKRLEMILEQRSEQVDSLRRIIDNRNARLAELQNRMKTTPTMTDSPPMLARSPKSPVAEPIRVQSGPFVEKYNDARYQFESYNYNGCIERMKSLLEENPNHPLADNAQYWIGESYYGLKQYQKAILEFQKVFSYNATDKYDDAQLMIGLCYVRLGQQDMAHSTFGEFLQTYSGSEYSGVARRYYQNI